MSDDSQSDVEGIRDLERSLEWATASTEPASSDMDPQTAALRQAWTAWGRLLESTETPMEPAMIRRPDPRLVRRRRITVGAGIAAAVLVVGVTTFWFAMETRREGDSVVVEAAKPQAAAPAVQERAVAETVAEAKWNDSVDEEIVRMGQTLVAFQQDWHTRADVFASVQSQLQIIGAEIESADGDNAKSTSPKKTPATTPEKSPAPGDSKGSLGPSSLIRSLCEAWIVKGIRV